MNANDIANRCLKGDLTEVQFKFLCTTHDVDPEQVKALVEEHLSKIVRVSRILLAFFLSVITTSVLLWLFSHA